MEKDQMTEKDTILTSEEMDTLGEVMNMSMGASATAISSMLDKQVLITTPKLSVESSEDVHYTELEPAMVIKIRFVEGLCGTNVMVFRRHDMQIILNLLMGNEDIPPEDDGFEFDDLSISAACEVTNQMMGSAATALSEILGETVNISTPDAMVAEPGGSMKSVVEDVEPDSEVVTISFDLSIKGVMNSNFMSVVPISFAKSIVNRLMSQTEDDVPEAPVEASVPAAQAAPPTPAAPQPMPVQPPVEAAQPAAQPAMPPVPQPVPSQPQQPMVQQQPAQQQPVPPMQQPAMPQQGYPPMQPGYPQQPYPGMMPPGYPPNYYMPQQPPATPSFAGPMGNMLPDASSVNVKKAQFPDFSLQEAIDSTMSSANMGLLLNVPLNVSVEIGRTKRKIKEIADFGQGTVIELEKQAGAPVDIVVNGQLLAHGDVVVIGDNFGVRITEIVGVRDLMNSLNGEG